MDLVKCLLEMLVSSLSTRGRGCPTFDSGSGGDSCAAQTDCCVIYAAFIYQIIYLSAVYAEISYQI